MTKNQALNLFCKPLYPYVGHSCPKKLAQLSHFMACFLQNLRKLKPSHMIALEAQQFEKCLHPISSPVIATRFVT